jgi:hypothetical protein
MNDRHHLCPLSLHGLNVPENIVTIHHDLHVHIHKIMNIPRREYSKLWRQYRKLFNGRTTVELDQVTAMLYMQQKYFDRYSALCPLAKKVHVRQMNEYVKFLRNHVGNNHTFQPSWGKLWCEYRQAFADYYLC